MTNGTPAKNTNEVLRYLDDLYAATESDQTYGEFVRASNLFFFSQSSIIDLTPDAHERLDAMNGFQQHVDRIDRLATVDSELGDTGGDLDSPLACFTVDAETLEVKGNLTAQDLMGRAFPFPLSALPVSDESSRQLRALISEAKSKAFQGARTLPIEFDGRDTALVTRCIKTDGFSTHEDDNLTLQFTVSFVCWTNDLLSFAVKEFGLTEAELDVLRELLGGRSQIQTADALGKSRETVKVQAKAILRKFGVSQMGEVHAIARAYAYLGQRSRVDRVSAPAVQGKAASGSRLMDVGHLRSVEVWEYGAKDGFPVIFWHGLALGPFFAPRMIDAFLNAGLRVISLSRPGFGRSSPPLRWEDFNDTVTADFVKVTQELGLGQMAFWVHQAGISFACRGAAALKGRILGAATNGAGVPIQPHMLSKMNMSTRVAAATVLHAPRLLEAMLRHGFKSWRVKGPRQFYRQFFGTKGVEQETLKDPEMARLFELGFLHTSAQVPDAMIWDGKSAMTNWIAEYDHFDFPQQWIHGDTDQILDASFVAQFLDDQGQEPLILLEGYGSDLLYRGFDKVFPLTRDFFAGLNPRG